MQFQANDNLPDEYLRRIVWELRQGRGLRNVLLNAIIAAINHQRYCIAVDELPDFYDLPQ